MNVNKNHQNYKRTIEDADTRAAVEARLSEAYATYGGEQLQAGVHFDIQTVCSKSNDDMMYPTASKEWSNNRNRSRLNKTESYHYQRNPANYEYNEDVDINDHSYREPNEEEIYNDYNFDGRKSALTSAAVNTGYSKNIRNSDNLITRSQDGATYRGSKTSSCNNKCAEKTTYCRPVLNVYRQDFIFKAIERNAKLQLLLKKLVIARRREKEEKERGEWNNYINKLKNTGHYLSNESRHIEARHIEPRHFESRHIESRYIEPRCIDSRHIEPLHMEPRYFESRHIESRHIEPRCIDSRHMELRHIEPRLIEPRPIEPRHMEPRHIELRHIESRHIEPRCIDSRHMEPRHIEPRHIEPRHIEPQPIEPRPIEPRSIEQQPIETRLIEPRAIEARNIEPRSIEQRPMESRPVEPRCIDSRHIEPRHIEPRHIEPRHIEPRHIEPRHIEPRHIEPRHIEPRHIEPRHIEPRHIEPRHIEPRHIERRHIEPRARVYFERSNQSPEFTNNPNSVIHDPPCRSLHEHEQEHSEPRFNKPEHNRAPVSPGFESGIENRPSFSITSSIDRLLTLANVWQLSTPHSTAVDRQGSPSRIPVDSGKYEDDSKGERCPISIKKENESSRQINPATTTGGICKTCPLGNTKQESSGETNPATGTGCCCKMYLLASRKEESSRETYSVTTMGDQFKTSLVPGSKEVESSREICPASTTGCYCTACVLARRKVEESLRETYPATTMVGHLKTSLVPGMKEEDSSRETYPATTTGGYCKACLLAIMKEEESLKETYPANTTAGYCKACLLARIKEEESSREINPATTTSGLCKTCPHANRKQESSRETNPATGTGCCCKMCLLASRKEESSRETYPVTTMGVQFKTPVVPDKKEEKSLRELYPGTTTGGYCKACLLANMKEEENTREKYPATATGGYCKACLLAIMKEEERLKETYPATTTAGYCKACLLARIKEEESSRETNPATTTGGLCKTCPLATRKQESSRETYAATTTGGHFQTSLVPARKDEESSWEINTVIKIDVPTQTMSIENADIEVIINDQAAAKDKYEEITLNVNRLKNLIDLQDQENQRRNSLRGIETKIELLGNSIKAILSKLESVKKVSDTSTTCVPGLHEFKNMAKGTSTSSDNEVKITPKSTCTVSVCDCDDLAGEPAERPEPPLLPVKREHPELPEKQERPGHPVDMFSMQTKYVVRPLPTKYRNISSSTSKIDKIMCEELVKSNQFRKDIEEILCQSNSSCAVQISFDIPTRERCTEVTDSLSKTKLMEEREISIDELTLSDDRNRQMTIAVNTDPMGLLAWFRMSSDTLKKLISYVPYVDYSRYLLRSPLPQLPTAAVDYVCNICGACFARPSLLNNHIRTHDLSNSRNCCICHHVLNIKPRSTRSAARFACRYCGQRFTRAYCCELHEQACARAMGRNHDVSSGHGLLR